MQIPVQGVWGGPGPCMVDKLPTETRAREKLGCPRELSVVLKCPYCLIRQPPPRVSLVVIMWLV